MRTTKENIARLTTLVTSLALKFVICCCVMIVFATTAFAEESEAEDLFKFEAGYPTLDASQAL